MEIKSLYVPPGGGVYESAEYEAFKGEAVAAKRKFWKRTGWISLAVALLAGAVGKGVELYAGSHYDEILSGGPAAGHDPVVARLNELAAIMGTCQFILAIAAITLVFSLMRRATLRQNA